MLAPVGSACLVELIGTTGPINNRSRLRHGHDNPMSAGFKALKGHRIALVLVVVLVLEKGVLAREMPGGVNSTQ
ncbi:MAG: hypothetical protein JOZ08_18975 [Verrucomicrobia bacterium]|nr:hypothetical protein [Verrucomicrobiota bacterium]